MKCEVRHPPGDEIYRNDDISVFEVCGFRQAVIVVERRVTFVGLGGWQKEQDLLPEFVSVGQAFLRP